MIGLQVAQRGPYTVITLGCMGNTIILLNKDLGHAQYYCIIDVNGSRIYSAEMWCSPAHAAANGW